MNKVHTSARAAGQSNYYFADKLREIRQRVAQGRDVINLGVGSPDLAPGDFVGEAIGQDMPADGAFSYQPYRGVSGLSAAVVQYMQRHFDVTLTEEGVLPLMGSKEGCGFLSLAHLDPGDGALVPDPGYPTYAAATRMAGGVALPYALRPETGYHPEVDVLDKQLAQALDKGCEVRILWLNYPHMPTGASPDQSRLKPVLQWAQQHGILVVNDNPYSRVLNSAAPFSLLSLKEAEGTAIELHSLSKSHRLAGGRVGFALGAPHLLAPLFRVSTQFASGSWRPMQSAAIAAMSQGEADIQRVNGIYGQRKRIVLELLERLGCDVRADQTGLFVWARAPHGTDGDQLSDAVLDQCDVFVTPGSIFGSEGIDFVRVSLCTPEARIEEARLRIASAFAQSHE